MIVYQIFSFDASMKRERPHFIARVTVEKGNVTIEPLSPHYETVDEAQAALKQLTGK